MNRHEQLTLVGLLMLWSCLTGCQALATGSDAQKQLVTPPQGMLTLDVRPAYGGKRTAKQIPFQPNMRLQNLLDSTKTGFRNKDIFIVRESPTTGRTHKLAARFENHGKISLETDYAIRPGDHVVIAESTVGPVEKAVRGMLGRS